MGWKETLTEKGKFRGVEFFVRSHTAEGGRRNARHEFPFRDLPAVEDLGRKAGSYNLELYVIGADYMPARDRLREALDAAGAGELHHPWLGRLRVNVDTWRLEESTDRGGIARFTVSFIESGDVVQPAATVDTVAVVEAFAKALQEQATAELGAQHDPTNLSGHSKSALQGSLTDLASKLRGDWSEAAGKINQVTDLAEAIYAQTRLTMSKARNGYGLKALINRVRGLGDLITGLDDGTHDGARLARSQVAVGQTVRLGLISAAAVTSSSLQHGSQAEAREVREALNALIDDEIERLTADGSPASVSLFYAMTDLRAAVSSDVDVRGLRLPDTVSWTPATTLPALVIAHRVYGDALRDGEIVTRNNIRHPGFVPGGTALEVLSE